MIAERERECGQRCIQSLGFSVWSWKPMGREWGGAQPGCVGWGIQGILETGSQMPASAPFKPFFFPEPPTEMAFLGGKVKQWFQAPLRVVEWEKRAA